MQPTPTVLIVDDEPALGRAAARALRSSELDVHVLEDPASALELLAEQHFDLVLSDYQMPGLDGVRLLDEVRRRHPRVRRVLMSAAPPADLQERLANGELEDFVAKPFGVDMALRVGTLLSTRATPKAIG
jgi:CheY-like chemotaxis protein